MLLNIQDKYDLNQNKETEALAMAENAYPTVGRSIRHAILDHELLRGAVGAGRYL